MKTKYIALALGAMLVCSGAAILSSCTQDPGDMIIGTWEWTSSVCSQSGSPNGRYDYSDYISSDYMGAGSKVFVFKKDNTGMMIVSGIMIPTDTSLFRYSIDYRRGDIMMADGNSSTTWTIEDIKRDEIVLHRRWIEEDYHQYIGDTTHYTLTDDEWFFCKKK